MHLSRAISDIRRRWVVSTWASSFVEFKPADKLHGLNEKDSIT